MALTAVSILSAYYPLDAKGTSMFSKYQKEIILSYRLLFGQNRNSRRLFREMESRHAALNNSGKCDPLLDVLCGRKKKAVVDALPSEIWPDSCRDSAGHLIEQTVYSTSLPCSWLAATQSPGVRCAAAAKQNPGLLARPAQSSAVVCILGGSDHRSFDDSDRHHSNNPDNRADGVEVVG